MDSTLQIHYEETFEIPATHFIDLGRMKGWADHGAPSDFEVETPGLGIQHLNHSTT